MTIEIQVLKKTNEVFNRLCSAMKLNTDDRVQLMIDAGYPVSKSKVVNWGSRGKNYADMPGEALTLFLERVQAISKSPMITYLAQQIAEAGEYERLGIELDALSELATLKNREYGYTPNNLRYECTKEGGREKFAELHHVSPTTLDNWCRQVDDPNHRDMPTKKWQEIFKNN